MNTYPQFVVEHICAKDKSFPCSIMCAVVRFHGILTNISHLLEKKILETPTCNAF